MSFTRDEYNKVFQFAAHVYCWFQSTGRDLEHEAVSVMDMCESVIGQLPNRPHGSRVARTRRQKARKGVAR